ncbi:carbohydrate ABC transporter permease [Niameybacter massiliensis]|uniref:carbohydrate ABC transporter permease n=1 Tax=Niameybacter massiliensis TaxID=1658108 RepID=UPI0006B59810|nr:carbohydrate ABC transporter permease [Niameybacter massiliensis]
MSKLQHKQTGVIVFTDFKKPKIKMFYYILLGIMIVIALLCLIPPLWIMTSSVKDIKEFFQIPPTFIPKTFQPEKLVETWKKLSFMKYYVNTIFVAMGSVGFSIIFNGLAGYVLSRLKPKGSHILFQIMMWTMMLPASVGMIPLFKNIIDVPVLHINLTDSYWPLWLMAGANAFYVIIFKSFFDSIPKDYIEAARLDGCSDLGIFARIILPLSKPVMTVVTIFTINSVWSDFLWPYITLKDPNKYTVMVKIFTMNGQAGYPADMRMIAVTFAIIPPAILFIIFQKKIMSGFNLGGIKG